LKNVYPTDSEATECVIYWAQFGWLKVCTPVEMKLFCRGIR